MSFALNEVEAIAKKAARGAGYPWGVAEEAAKATRWLCANGVDGAKALATLVAKTDGTAMAEMTPGDLSGDWGSQSSAICPLLAGATLSDFAGVRSANEINIMNVVAPVMLLPFAAMAARHQGQNMTVEWDGVSAVTNGTSLSFEGAKEASLSNSAARVAIRAGAQINHPMPLQSRATPDAADWAKLTEFAQRTYAPATTESRLKGAGAGLSDND